MTTIEYKREESTDAIDLNTISIGQVFEGSLEDNRGVVHLYMRVLGRVCGLIDLSHDIGYKFIDMYSSTLIYRYKPYSAKIVLSPEELTW